MLADLDAGDVGGDRLELAAELGRGVGLQVEGVDGAQPAVQEEEDERDIARRLAVIRGGAWRFNSSGSVRPRPKTPAVPRRRKSRRAMPSQKSR